MKIKVDTAVTVPVNVMPLIDDNDFKTIEAAVAFNAAGMALKWNFQTPDGVTTQTAVTPTAAGDYDWATTGAASGMYEIEIPASGGASINNDTEGNGWFTGVADGVLPWVGPICEFVPANISDSLVKGTDNLQADAVQISGDGTSADNLELQYDGSGLAGDTFPATQAQLGNISTGTASINITVASTEDTTPAVVGTPTNTYTSTVELDGTYHSWVPAGGELEFAYNFNIGANAAPVSILWQGFAQLVNDSVAVYARNWVGVSWEQVGTIDGTALATVQDMTFNLTTAHTNTGANAGDVRIRFVSTGGSIINDFATDRILCSFTTVAQSVGYANGAIWVDTNASNENTTDYIDGVADNPVSTWATALTLNNSLGLNRFHIANGSTVTLSGNSDNFTLSGKAWAMDLNSKSIAGMAVQGADISGVGTGATEPQFLMCHFGNTTLPPSHLENCGLQGTLTLSGAGDYFLDHCHSMVTGTNTPIIDFEDAAENKDLNMRGYSGGIEIRNIGQAGSTDTMALEGWGVLVLASTCEAATISVRGCFTITDNVGGGGFVDGAGGTLNDDARYDVDQVADAVVDEVLTGAAHNISNSLGRRIRELDEQIGYEGGAIWIDTENGVSGTTIGEHGTVNNPVDNITNALALAVAIGIVRLRVASGSTITLVAALEGYEIYNSNWTLVLGGQSVSGSCIIGAGVSGICTGANAPDFKECHFGNATLPPCHLIWCGFGGTITAGSAGDFFFDNCHSSVAGTSAPVFDFGSGLGASNVNYRNYSGGVDIRNMGAGAGSYNMSLEGNGQLIVNANCSATSTIAIRGNFTVSGDATAIAAITFSDDARFDVAQINAEVVDALQTDTPVDGKSITDAIQIIGAGVAGKVSGAGTGTEVFKGLDGSTTRITVSVDGSGNRTVVVYG